MNCRLCRSSSAPVDVCDTRVISASCAADGEFEPSSRPAGVSTGGDVSSVARARSSFHIIGSSLWKSIHFLLSFVIYKQHHSVLKIKIIQHWWHPMKIGWKLLLNCGYLIICKHCSLRCLCFYCRHHFLSSFSSDTYFLHPTNWLTTMCG